SFALIALCCRGLSPHSQTVFGRGAVSLPGSFLASILPGLRLLDWPVKLPSSREGDRYFVGLRPLGTATTSLPSSEAHNLFMSRQRTLQIGSPQLIHEAAHTNVHNHPQRQEHEQHGRPTVTHQWQGYSGDRHKADHHADIDQDMETKHSHHTHHHERASAVGRRLRVLGQTHQHYEV